jgi:hypothetical protein
MVETSPLLVLSAYKRELTTNFALTQKAGVVDTKRSSDFGSE